MRRLMWPACLAGAALFAQETVSVRVRFGLTDTEARPWDGKVTASGGEVTRLASWRPRPDHEITGTSSWRISSTKGVNFRNRNWEPEPMTPHLPYVKPTGLIVDIRGSQGALLRFETKNGSFTVRPFEMQPGAEQRFLGGAVAVDRVPVAERLSSDGEENDFAALAAGDGGALWAAWVAYSGGRNRIKVRRFDGRAWSAPETISGDSSDIFLVKAARDGRGGVWFVWSAQVDGNFDLYGRRVAGGRWSAIERLTSAPQPDIFPALAADAHGNVWLVWQGFRDGQSDVFARSHDGSAWSAEERLSLSAANNWEPAIAADAKGSVHVAWDSYDRGNYDVLLTSRSKGAWSEPAPIADTPKFEAHVSLACDRDNRLWAAWNESGTRWGKDTGFLVKVEGTRLYQARWIAVAVREGGRWREPVTPLEEGLPEELRGYNDLPLLGADGAGRVWLLFRHRHPRILDVPSDAPMHRAAWELHAITYDGSRWLPPMSVPFSQGRTDMRSGVAVGADGALHVAWPTDGRRYEDFLFRHGDIYSARLAAVPRNPEKPALKDRVIAEWHTYPIHPNEKQDVARIRGYAIRSGGKTYRIYRGDTHRHTEFSHDGHNDGSLVDTYRYALDAAALDYLMVSEHNETGGPDVDYINWLLQQMCDVLLAPGAFVPLFGYERSVSFPDGHRNVIFARRGNPTLPIPEAEAKHRTGAKALYEYLRRYDGIAISHTSATGMGTDWRDNDPEVEPLVEIFQGDRVSAEYEGAPTAAVGDRPTTQAGGFRREGYVWNAWAKGYKLGVQASSDHLSTHYSYAAAIAEEFTREGLLEAMKKRHSYGATDNIILDYRLQDGDREHLQGDIVEASRRFRLWIKVIGTAPVRQIDIIRNNTFLHTRQSLGAEVDFSFADADVKPGQSYYYVRVQQADGQIAWSSPIWVTVK